MNSAFTEAILVTPMGALSVVVAAILSHFMLKEKLTFFVSPKWKQIAQTHPLTGLDRMYTLYYGSCHYCS